MVGLSAGDVATELIRMLVAPTLFLGTFTSLDRQSAALL